MGRRLRDTVGPLVNGQSLDVVTIPVPAGQSIGGVITYHAEIRDGVDIAAETVTFAFSAVNKAGTVTFQPATPSHSLSASNVEVLLLDMDSNVGHSATATEVTLTIEPVITGTPTRSALRYEVTLLSPVTTIANPA